jgi:flagellar basal body-associated protein FliL
MLSVLFNRSNRFNFFVAGYSAIFALLAFWGGIEAARYHDEQRHITKEVEKQVDAATKGKELYKLPRMDVTMSALQGETHHVRLGISLEMDKKNTDKFIDYQPRVSDRIISFLDHQNLDEFTGPHFMYNLRRDILFEANKASGPVVISNVIFRELVVR